MTTPDKNSKPAAIPGRTSPDYGGKSSREKQITVQATPEMVELFDDVIHYLNQHRKFGTKKYDKKRFYNSLLLGVLDFHYAGDFDIEEFKKKGLVLTLIDRGALLHSRKEAIDTAPYGKKGRDLEAGGKANATEPSKDAKAQPHRKLPGLRIPKDYLFGDN
ncbi:MAG: hypothetical protein P4L67_04765 [Candidatus Pacebacteria bacterium]|nr:hypothetical protein [Candidatus Paceibacterota bacterium]